MAAIVQIYEANGGTDGTPGTKTRVDGQNLGDGVATDVRFCTADAYNDVAVHPCIIPSSGFNYSYWKQLYLNITGTFTTVNNINFYTDGTIGWTLGTGGGLYVGTRTAGDNGVPMDASYEVATGTPGSTGNTMLTDHARCATGGSVALAGNYTSGSELLLDSTDYSTADESNAVLLQVKIDTSVNGAANGTQSDEIIYMAYDEI